MEKNFKILIGSLAGVIVVLIAVLAYVWIDRNSYIDEITIDKENLTAEMLQLQEDYANLTTTNDTLNNELILEREKVAQLIERVKQTEATNRAQLRKYEKELGTLRSIMRGYIKQIDSLNTLNTNLRAEAAEAKQEARESRNKYEDLKSTTEELGKQVEIGSVVKGRSLVMVGVTETGKETDRSSRTAKLKACLYLVENSIAKKGPKTIYIRIKGPDGILMTTDQQQIFTCAGEQMIYSASRTVDYQGSEVEVCIYFTPGQKFTKGVYSVDAYTEESKLVSSDVLLR